jgi:hypothetical protein
MLRSVFVALLLPEFLHPGFGCTSSALNMSSRAMSLLPAVEPPLVIPAWCVMASILLMLSPWVNRLNMQPVRILRRFFVNSKHRMQYDQ